MNLHFDITDLRLFIHVVDAGTITAGAQRSHLSLAAASERILRMEAHIDTPLLVRERRGVRPTSAGHSVLRHARMVVQQMEELQAELSDHGEGLSGTVRLLCNTSTLSEHLPAPLASFLALHPRVSVHICDKTSQLIVDALRSGSAQIGIVASHVDISGLDSLPFGPDPLVLVAPRAHPLASRRMVALAELCDLPFIGLGPDTALQTLITQQTRQLGRHLHYRAQLNHLEAVCQMVGLNVGFAIMPQQAAQRHAAALGITPVALSDAWAQRQLSVCFRSLEGLTNAARALALHLHHVAASG